MPATIGTNSYTDATAYNAYAAERGITVNAATLDADLILSADFIDTYYNFKGMASDPAQMLKLPTDEVSIADISKGALKAAELQQAGRLALDAAVLTGGLVDSESKTLEGVGSISKSYAEGSQVTYKPRVPELDLLLRPFTVGGMGIRKT